MKHRAPPPRPLPTRPEVFRSQAKRAEPGVSAWRVFLKDLELLASIGVHAHEHENRQRILVDIELEMTGAATPKDDRLAETVDYEAIARAVEEIAWEGHVQLVETLAERVARWCLKDPRVAKALVRVTKPEALTNARGSGCEIEVSRE